MKFGTIGTSWITESYIEASLKNKRWDYKSAYSRDLKRAKEFTKNYEVDCYDNLEEFADSGIEAVYIASPNSLHFEHSKYFLERGIYVICEKPICISSEQLDELLKIADENNVYIFDALRHIHTPNFNIIKDSLKRIGKIRQLNLNFNQYSSRYNDFKNGNIKNVFSLEYGGGALMDLGIYPVSFCVTLFGMPKNSTYKAIKLENGIDGCGTLVMEYDDFLASMSFSKITSATIENEILGENGGICFNHIAQQDKIFISLEQKKENVLVSDEPNNMVYEADVFFDIIANKNRGKYLELTKISRDVMKILDKSRLQNNIVWRKNDYYQKSVEISRKQQTEIYICDDMHDY